ncbi:winged helix DNA-binding domain-containing protein [Rhodocytophaga rosea]|uniref:Winged helix DNA-binding domain-containing protein n=1 Tax=Rhodocytophaga rosea TaxID=2704465 RepID=A0A6C0GI62_9BACT|nr:winged helix DNA-binding domain-containing protein [Rhodocytophaga rosea]QHT67649.1 winged helix DNA-binding domain-containing protein [Rhodocytophaga rosea]
MNEKLSVPGDILNSRILNQQLVNSTCTTPKAVVSHMGAMQAQDYAMAKWAIGVRLPASTEALIEKAIDEGDIIRTHILRPTWHLVAADDIRWMMQLTAPHVNRLAATMYRQLEIDGALQSKTNEILIRLLEGGKQLTREEIMAALSRENITTNELRSYHIMFRAELDQIVCSGARRGKQFTYALFEERIPPGKPHSREEALAKLVQRYFTSHGPATVHDFAWWSGLTITEIKQGLELVKPILNHIIFDKKTYYFVSRQAEKFPAGNLAYLLPAFDEFLISYTDRSLCLDPTIAREAISSNGIFKPVLVMNGKIVGLWKRTIKKNTVAIQLYFSDKELENSYDLFAACIEQYGKFLNLNTVIN